MSTVALIGADGAGKTTIANKLQKSYPRPLKYIYMGLNIESSNYALPTSRLILRLKLIAIKKKAEEIGNTDPEFLTTHHIAHRSQKRNKLGVFLRTFNRLAEAWYRQFISCIFQLQGYIVLYDRHFLFDTAPFPGQEHSQPFADRAYRWLLANLGPQTDLVIFLDADPETLLSRKQEVPLEYLANKRASFLAQGQRTSNFVRIDATQPIDKVFAEVIQHMMQIQVPQHHQRLHGNDYESQKTM